MRKSFCFFAVICISLIVPRLILAQGMEPDRAGKSINEKVEKKRPGLFHRTAMSTPQQQLEYADKLLAEGRRRAALKQYLALVHAWHESAEAPRAQLAYAKLLEEQGKHEQAFQEFQYLIDHFAGQFPFEEALDHQFRIANYLMTSTRCGFLCFKGFSAPERALPLFAQIVKNGPQWERTPDAQFSLGLINEDTGEYDQAVNAYAVTYTLYPKSPAAPQAAFRRARCLYLIANANPRNEPSYREALSALSIFLKDYPAGPDVETAKKLLNELKERLAAMYYERAFYYDKIAQKPKSAIIAYEDFVRNFPNSELASKAVDRIDTLKLLDLEKKNEK